MALDGPNSTKLKSTLAGKRRNELESLIVAPYRQRRSIRVEVLVGRMFLEVVREVLQKKYDLLIKPAENPPFIER